MADLVQHPVVPALAWALVHFIWQGAVIGLAAFFAFRFVRESASLRYAIGVGALTAMLVAPIATFVAMLEAPVHPLSASAQDMAAGDASELAVAAATDESGAPARSLGFRLSPAALAVAVCAWLAGVTFFSLRLLGGWVVARRMARQSVRPAAAHIQALVAHVAERLALRGIIAVLESSAVVVPVMVGWLKPTIVLPIAALAGLTPTQVEALLAHELAHIRRHDYLVNLLQSVTEAILFYHPAVWWLSRRIRMERELCCDDLAVGVCDPLVYATALTDLAAMTSPRVALAATDGDLLGRVRRILGHSESHANTRGSIMSGLAFGLVATIAIPVALISATQAPRTTAPESAKAAHVQQATAERAARVAEAAQQTDEKRRAELQRAMNEILKQLATLEVKHAETLRAKIAETHRKNAIDVAPERAALQEIHAQARDARAREVETSQAAASVNLEIAAARRELERARQQFEKGLTSRSQLLEAETALARLQVKGNTDAARVVELHAARENLARSRALVEKGLMASRHATEAEVARQGGNARQLAELLVARQADRARTADETLRHLTVELEPEIVVGADEQVRAGDTLRITIEGEPSLPPTYRVSEDGTIRIPFLGAIKVVGLTTTQARAAVGNQLSARKLGTASQVKVTVARPRIKVSRNIKVDVDPVKKPEAVFIKVEPVIKVIKK